MPYTCAMKITATPCIIEVPSILIVAPSGIVKDEIFLETPIFLSSVSMESGMVALDVAVVNANIITGENLFKKRSGLSRVKTNSSSWYTTRHCTASARVTAPIYLSIGRKASKPISANVLAIRQNTPIGATFITAIVISIIKSLNCAKKLDNVLALLPILASSTPINSANTMIGSISPFAIAPIGFFGMIFSSVSAIETCSVLPISALLTFSMATPVPGSIISAIPKATIMASAVVHR